MNRHANELSYEAASHTTSSEAQAGNFWDDGGKSSDPLAVATSTGWGDGYYPVYADYVGSRIMAIHIDFASFYPPEVLTELLPAVFRRRVGRSTMQAEDQPMTSDHSASWVGVPSVRPPDGVDEQTGNKAMSSEELWNAADALEDALHINVKTLRKQVRVLRILNGLAAEAERAEAAASDDAIALFDAPSPQTDGSYGSEHVEGDGHLLACEASGWSPPGPGRALSPTTRSVDRVSRARVFPIRRGRGGRVPSHQARPRAEDLRRLQRRTPRIGTGHQATTGNATRRPLPEPPRPHPHTGRDRRWFAQRVRGGAGHQAPRVQERARIPALLPRTGLHRPRLRRGDRPLPSRPGRVDWLEWDDVHRLIDAIPEYRLKMAAAWLFYTGCRVGEAIDAQQRDVRLIRARGLYQWSIPERKTHIPRNVWLPESLATYIEPSRATNNPRADWPILWDCEGRGFCRVENPAAPSPPRRSTPPSTAPPASGSSSRSPPTPPSTRTAPTGSERRATPKTAWNASPARSAPASPSSAPHLRPRPVLRRRLGTHPHPWIEGPAVSRYRQSRRRMQPTAPPCSGFKIATMGSIVSLQALDAFGALTDFGIGSDLGDDPRYGGRGRTFESCRAHGSTKPFLSRPEVQKRGRLGRPEDALPRVWVRPPMCGPLHTIILDERLQRRPARIRCDRLSAPRSVGRLTTWRAPDT